MQFALARPKKADKSAVRKLSGSREDLIGGNLDKRLEGAPRRMFKSVGGGLQDVVVAEVILRKALESGLTTPLPFDFDAKDPND